MVEQGTHNPLVVGSNPTGPTTHPHRSVTTNGSKRRAARAAAKGLRSRVERLGRRRMRASVATVAFSLLGCLLVAGGGAWAFSALTARPASAHLTALSSGPLPSASIASADGSSSVSATASLTASGAVDVEVPSIVGKPVKVAEALLTAAGLTVQTRVSDPPAAGVSADQVVAQYPAARALVSAGACVVVTYQPRTDAGQDPFVVVIDPGHQKKPDLALEPIGPGSTQSKERVAGGVTGVSTGVPEYARALEIALKLRTVLVAKGVKVVMVRTANDVDIPNSERAAVGNAAKADLVVRVHMGAVTDASLSGISTLYPSGNKWVQAIQAASLNAAGKVQTAAVAATGAHSRGIEGRADQSGFNYSKRPSIVVECGMMSNASEDARMATTAYQQKLADGIATGIMAFLQGK